MQKYLVKEIVKTLWVYGLNPNSLHKRIYSDGSCTWYFSSNRFLNFNLSNYDIKNYLSWIRNPLSRTDDYINDKYEISIYKYDKNGNTIKKYYSKDKE